MKTTFLSGAALAVLCAFSFPKAYAQASAQEWKKVAFHEANGTREASVVYELYKPFLKANPNVRLQTAVLRLSPDKKQNGSIAVRFVSEATCVDAGNSCLTNMLWFDSRPGNTPQWKEVWSRHTSTVWVGPISPTKWGAGMYEIAGNDGIVWRWIGQDFYYPDLRSVATPWMIPTPASASLVGYATDLHPEYFQGKPRRGQGVFVMDQSIKLNDVDIGHVLTYQSGALCGQSGCPFVIVSGSPGTYNNLGEGIIDSLGGTIAAGSAISGSSNGWNSIVVQVAGRGLEFYRYNEGQYRPYMTTYSSDVTHTP